MVKVNERIKINNNDISDKELSFYLDQLIKFEEENKKIDIEYLSLENIYSKKENISDIDLNNFIKENEKELKIEYLDFDYAVLNPKNLVGLDEFNQAFFDKIDEIEVDISNEI